MAASCALVALALGGCGGGGGGLSATCSDFVSAGDQEQLDISAKWGNPLRDGSATELSRSLAPSSRTTLLEYCSQDGHGDEEIGSLERTVG